MTVIGLTGKNASGKGTVATYLKNKGYAYYSLSDELRLLLKKRKISATRKNLIKHGTLYRTKYANGYFATLVSKKIKRKNAVVDSIRNLGEILELRKFQNFVLIAVDAPLQERFNRQLGRNSKRDKKTLAAFTSDEKKELTGTGSQQQLLACIKKADFKIINDSTIKNLYNKIETILQNKKLLQITKNDFK